MRPLNERQLELIETGKQLTSRLREAVEVSLGVRSNAVTVKRHAYIFSLPGAGKTFTTAMTAEAHGVQMLQVRGSTSIPALARALAYAKCQLTKGTELVVWVDDCDTLFMDEESLNVMKGALDEDVGMLVWNKNLNAQIQRDLESDDPNTRAMGMAMKTFQPAGSPGVAIPMTDVRFIITSNKDLCAPSRIYVPGKKITKRQMHEGALRDRVNYHEFLLNTGQSWGWCASVLLEEGCDIGIPMSLEEKIELLHFMYANWGRLPSTSMRGVKDLAATMKNNPETYTAVWEGGLVK